MGELLCDQLTADRDQRMPASVERRILSGTRAARWLPEVNAGRQADQRGAEQRPVDATEPPVAEPATSVSGTAWTRSLPTMRITGKAGIKEEQRE